MTGLPAGPVLVTGASGLIGSHLLEQLGPDLEVVALSRTPPDAGDGVRWIACDLGDPGRIGEIVRSVNPRVVFHLAGAVRGDRTLDAVAPTLRANLVGTVELLEAATRAGCERIVISGSLLEEPARPDPQPVPPSPYGASRWAASAYGRMFHELFDAPVVNLRPSFAYGPGQERSKLIPHVVTTLLDGGSPELSSGERRLDCVHAEDVARAYVAAATAPRVEGRTVDIGCGEPASVREIVDMLVEIVGPTEGAPVFGAVPVRALEQEIEVDVEEAARLLGWRASIGLEDGLRRTVEWFQARAEGRAVAARL